MARSRTLIVVIAVAAIAAATLIALVPFEAQLGHLLKLVLFHGASTWVNLVTFTAAAVLGVLYLATGREGVYRWGSTMRYMSAMWWVVNTALGVLSMRLVWGGFAFDEPRMQLTFWVLLGAFAILAVEQIVPRRPLLAALDLALAEALWLLLLVTPKLFHPDNPVFNTGGLVLYLFIGIVVTLGIGGAAGAVLLSRRLGSGPALESVTRDSAAA